jgi:hypothetical protein
VNAIEARAIIEASGKAVLVLAGHVHWNAMSMIDAIAYWTLASLTDTFAKDGEPSGSWAILELPRDGIAIEGFGSESFRWWAPLRPQHKRWVRPLARGDFDDRMRSLWREEAGDAKTR